MRRAKLIVLSSLGVVLLTVAAAVIFLATAGDGFYRWALGQAIEGRLDRRVVVDGSFSFDVGLEPSLIVTDVWIENAPGASKQEIARAERVEVQVALRPLLSGIVLIPRLVVEGLDVQLETLPDGQRNWEGVAASGDGADRTAPEDLFLPLFEFVSLRGIAVTHRNRQSGRDTEVLLDFLDKTQPAGDASFAIEAEGALNGRPFQIAGRMGSIEQALAATTPYPVELTLRSANLIADLTGTAQDLGAAEGLDLSLTVQAPSISEVLTTLAIDLSLRGSARANVRLQGNLESLAAENFAFEVIEESGQQLLADGQVADLVTGEGLDVNFDAILGPGAFRLAGELPPGLSALRDGVIGMELIGRITGNLRAPVIEDVLALLDHDSGADLSLQGRAELDFSESGGGLAAFEASTLLFLPNQALLEAALETPIPALGPMHVTADLAWAGDWISLRSAELDLEALARLQVGAEGRIGQFSAKHFAFELDPQIDISATALDNRPLVFLFEALTDDTGSTSDPSDDSAQDRSTASGGNLILSIQRGLVSAGLDPGRPDGKMGPATRAAIEDYQVRHGLAVDGRATAELLRHLQGVPGRDARPISVGGLLETLPEIAPVVAAVRLSRDGGAYRFDDLNLKIGAKEALQVDVSGTLGPLRPERDAVFEEIALVANVAVPSSATFAQWLPPEIPELTNLVGRFNVEGTTRVLSASDVLLTADGPDDLAAKVTGQVGEISLENGFATTNLALDLDARWPDTKGIYQFADLDLPDLGPVLARATVRDRGETFALTGIEVTAGAPIRPAVRMSGEIVDLLALKGIALAGTFDIPTATALAAKKVALEAALGDVQGDFQLTDADGSVGIEALTAELKNTELFAVSVTGRFDDLAQIDELRFETALDVPDVSALGRAFGFEVERPSSLSFAGEVSGGNERFRADGKARIGETDLTGAVTGSLAGERPALQAKLHSPLFRLADFGLVPDADAPETAATAATAANAGPLDNRPVRRFLFREEPIAFGSLKGFDLDLDVQLDELEGIRLDIDEAKIRLNLNNGLLKVDPLLFNFAGGRIQMGFVADARTEPPAVGLDIVADDVDVGDFLRQVEVDVPLDGQLDMTLDLEANGGSPRALASSLEGGLDLAISEGQVLTSILDLTVTNPLRWMLSQSARRGYSDLNCLVVRFDFQKGVATTVRLLLDTTNVRAEGEGDIDFKDEVLNIAVNPRAKRRRLIALSTPFTIEGPLANPTVNVSTAGAATRVVGKTVASPVNLLGSLVPFVNDHGRDTDNACLNLEDGELSPTDAP